MQKRIKLSKGSELLLIPAECLMYVSSEGNYSHIITTDGRKRLVSYQLGQIEDIISEQLGDEGTRFLRIGRCLIINTDYIHVIDANRQLLVLSDFKGNYHELSASRDVLVKVRAYIESIESCCYE